jgi:RNase H-fold protein (predicted Holliday junction resolvase)
VSRVLGVDPGMRKAGYALLDESGQVVERGIEPIESLTQRLGDVVSRHRADVIALGGGTNARAMAAALAPLGIPHHLVDERESTLAARRLYYADHPARGLAALVPLGMRFPPRAIDDYAAEIIARRWLAGHEGKTGKPS